jgi:hypothetical protein
MYSPEQAKEIQRKKMEEIEDSIDAILKQASANGIPPFFVTPEAIMQATPLALINRVLERYRAAGWKVTVQQDRNSDTITFNHD